jgi:hypothetical protein
MNYTIEYGPTHGLHIGIVMPPKETWYQEGTNQPITDEDLADLGWDLEDN